MTLCWTTMYITLTGDVKLKDPQAKMGTYEENVWVHFFLNKNDDWGGGGLLHMETLFSHDAVAERTGSEQPH